MKHPTQPADPSEIILSVTMQDIISAISRRNLTVTPEELELAREEVKEAISHHLDIREYIDIGLDAWEITRHLYS